MSRSFEIRHGNARYAVVSSANLRAGLSRDAAQRLLTEGLQNSGRSFERRVTELAEKLGGSPSRNPTSVVIEALVSGRLVVVRMEDGLGLMAEPVMTDLQELGDLGEPLAADIPPPSSEPEPATTWVSFEVVDEKGRPADGEFRLGLDARVISGGLDQQVHRVDGLREAVRVELFVEQLRWTHDDPAQAADRPAPSSARQQVAHAPGGRLEPLELDPGEHAQVVVRRPHLRRIQRPHLRFRPNSALLVPSGATDDHHPLASIMAALHVLDDEFDSALTVVGHADPQEANADGLARARAEGIIALLRDAKDDWVAIATSHGSLSNVAEYVNYLGQERRWSCHMGPPDQAPSDEATAGLTAFQGEYNRRFDADILEDGVCGRQTLGAMFAVLRYELERWMEKHEVPDEAVRLHPDVPHLGASARVATNAPEALGEAPLGVGRMVDLVLSTPESLLDETLSVDLLYLDGRTTYETLPVEHEPGAWEFGSVFVYLPEDDAVRHDLRYELKSHQGDYDRILALADDATARDGFYEFEFEDVPTASDYRLLAHSGPDTTLLFEGVPYADIETIDPVRSQDVQVPYLKSVDA
ncbi:MAG: hypothetical protein AAF799_20155 [Myxococcota bacterium]